MLTVRLRKKLAEPAKMLLNTFAVVPHVNYININVINSSLSRNEQTIYLCGWNVEKFRKHKTHKRTSDKNCHKLAVYDGINTQVCLIHL